jgi:hypothetical protein
MGKALEVTDATFEQEVLYSTARPWPASGHEGEIP